MKERGAPDEIVQRGFGLLPPHSILIVLAENLAANQELRHFPSSPEKWQNLIGESGAVIGVCVSLHH